MTEEFSFVAKITLLIFTRVSFPVRKGYSCWYWCMSLKYIGNVTSGSSSMLYISNIIYVVYVDSCEVSWFLLLCNHDSASAAIFLSPIIYSIFELYYCNTNIHRATQSVMKFLHIRFYGLYIFNCWPIKIVWNSSYVFIFKIIFFSFKAYPNCGSVTLPL